MPHATVRPISTPRPAPASLVALTAAAALALAGAPGHALPMADDDVSMTVSSEIVVKEDETYTAKFTMSDLTHDTLVGCRWAGVSFRWYCGVGGLVVGH